MSVLAKTKRYFRQRTGALLRDEGFREFLWWCVPGLLVGIVVRALLTAEMPFGYMQFDTADFLVTAQRFITTGDAVIHGKKTFLVPILYAFPFVLHIPALIIIPLAQHFLGLLVILFVGAL